MRNIPHTKRTRFSPGPLVAIAAILIVLTGSAMSAHDPGLSALDIVVGRGTITMSLSMASADAAVFAPGTDSRGRLISLAREAIRISVNGDALSSIDEEVSVDTSGARVRTAFAIHAPLD